MTAETVIQAFQDMISFHSVLYYVGIYGGGVVLFVSLLCLMIGIPKFFAGILVGIVLVLVGQGAHSPPSDEKLKQWEEKYAHPYVQSLPLNKVYQKDIVESHLSLIQTANNKVAFTLDGKVQVISVNEVKMDVEENEPMYMTYRILEKDLIIADYIPDQLSYYLQKYQKGFIDVVVHVSPKYFENKK